MSRQKTENFHMNQQTLIRL